jgi:Flp pilus assembly protein CpaB
VGAINNKIRFFIALAMGIVCLVVFYYRFNSMEQSFKNKRYGSEKTVRVLVANEDIQKMAALKGNLFAGREIPESFVQPGAILESGINDVNGLLAAIAIQKNTQILSTMMTQKFEAGNSLAEQLLGDARAMTINVDVSASVSGLIRPQDNVTVVECFKSDGQSQIMAKPLFDSLYVLAVGNIFDPNKVPEGYAFSTITLQVTMDQARELLRAQRNNQIHIILNPRKSTGNR